MVLISDVSDETSLRQTMSNKEEHIVLFAIVQTSTSKQLYLIQMIQKLSRDFKMADL